MLLPWQLPFEALESRTHLSVSQNEQGWTVITPEPDSRVIYVSSSKGSDSNSGRSPETPVKSISKGASLLRDDSSDQLLLKRGDVWYDQTLGSWWKSGKSAQEPLLIGAYGSGARPRLNTGQETAFEAVGGGSRRIDHVAIMGIQMVAHTRLPGDDFKGSSEALGVRLLAPTKNFLIEDCYIGGYTSNITFQAFYGDLTDLRVRRSVIVDSYHIASKGHSQGLYAQGVTGLTLEENLFDHNGWNEEIGGAGATMFNHNVYLRADNTGVVVRGNLFSRGASHGMQARAGGIIENNLFLQNAIGMSFGRVNGSPATPGGVTGKVKGNVYLGGNEHKIQGTERGWALDVSNIKKGAGVTIEGNIFSGDGGGQFPAMTLAVGDGLENKSETVGVNDLTIKENIVYKWAEGIRLDSSLQPGEKSPDGLNGLVVRDNDFQRLADEAIQHDMDFDDSAETWSNNRYNADHGRDGGGRPDMTLNYKLVKWDKWKRDHESSAKLQKVDYPAPERTVATYNQSLGGAKDSEAFIAEMRKSSSQNWRPQYTPGAAVKYIQVGFGKATDPVAVAPAPNPDAPANPPVNPDPQPGGPPAVPPVATANIGGEVQLTAGDAALLFSVTYIDDTGGIDVGTLNSDDLRLVGRRGFDQPASLVAVEQAADGNAVIATYSVSRPEGKAWKRADRGTYKLVANADAVRDVHGLSLAGADLSEFTVAVNRPAPPDKPPTVRKARFTSRGDVRTVTATFSEDVGASIDASDLVIFAEDGSRAVDPAQVALAYDAQRKTATWTLPAGMAEGKYRFVLSGGGITDSAGQPLDGNRNGEGGDDFAPQKEIRI